MIHRALCIAALAAAVVPATAIAQNASQESVARRHFNDGVAAYRARDYEKARELFAKAHALAPDHLLVLFSLADTEAKTGRLIEATRHFQKFLSATTDADHARLRARANQALAGLATRTPSIKLRILGLDRADSIKVNGQPFAAALLGEQVPVNPGELVIEVVRGVEVIATRKATLAETATTETVEMQVPLAPRPDEVVDKPPDEVITGPSPEPRDDGGSSVLSSGWFWLTTAAIVGAGAGAGYYFLHYRPRQPDPTMGTLGGGIELD